jgi:hypothetical protein
VKDPLSSSASCSLCQKYNLTVEDIYQMRATWDGIQGGSYEFFAPVFAIWDYMVCLSAFSPLCLSDVPPLARSLPGQNIPHITICNWLLEAIVPDSMLQLSFSEYVHLISFYSVFGLQEKIRFIFGYMCSKSHQTIT